MVLDNRAGQMPAIVMAQSDYDKLARMAVTPGGPEAEAASDLMAELGRAGIVPDEDLPPGVVRLGSTLTFRTDAGQERQVTLVVPQEADIAQGKVSVLTPIGAALIGLSMGQSIDWTARDGRIQRLTVTSVEAGISA